MQGKGQCRVRVSAGKLMKGKPIRWKKAGLGEDLFRLPTSARFVDFGGLFGGRGIRQMNLRRASREQFYRAVCRVFYFRKVWGGFRLNLPHHFWMFIWVEVQTKGCHDAIGVSAQIHNQRQHLVKIWLQNGERPQDETGRRTTLPITSHPDS
jgi:hypothetical protein